MDERISLFDLMEKGGWVMWGLAVFSVVALAVIVERVVVLRRARLDAGSFLQQIRKSLLVRHSMAEAVRLCDECRKPLAQVARAALARFGKKPVEIERAMETAARYELRRLQRGLVVLATVANLAPLLGFLGTVTGMIQSFGIIADLQLADPARVAGGIEAALTTTAGGLTVAIPVQLAYNLFQSRISGLIADIETAGDFLLDLNEEAAIPAPIPRSS